MLRFLRNDPQVFAMFKPNKLLLRKMNIQSLIVSEHPQESALGLEFASFLLRYHVTLDYGDFTDDPFCIQKLRRYEDVKYATEVENVTKAFEELSARFVKLENYQSIPVQRAHSPS